MPRNYKKKGTKVKWTAEEMSNVLKDIRENKMNVMLQQENMVYQIRQYMTGKVKDNAKVGWRTLLLPEEEMDIVKTCIIFANLGYGMDKLKVMKIVQSYLKYHKRKLHGKNNKLGYDWYKGFLQRHKAQLSVSKTQKLQVV